MDIDVQWNWTEFCSTGLKPFTTDSNNLLPCFQEIVLQLPIYSLFAIISAYNFGYYNRPVHRNELQLRLINTRIYVVIILAFLPVLKLFAFHHELFVVNVSDILVVCIECIMWMMHIGHLLSLRRTGDINHRGPMYMNVLWLIIFLLDLIWLKSTILFDWWYWSLITCLFDLIYAITLIPNGKAVQPRLLEDREQEALLSNRFTYFQFDLNETHLGHSQDGANFVSRFFFNWVTPLIEKGVAGGLKKIDDIFDLPEALNITKLSERLQLRIHQSKSLIRALHKAFGREFYLIGLLRFVADTAGFAGPLLLGGLLSQNSQNTENTENNTETNVKPYLYAMGLFFTTLITALCSTHFNWRMSMIGMKMRIGVVSAIYRKALEARGLHESKPEILNLMSTDTDRIVNSCISFHSFWSIPFQLFTTLYLLYTQLGSAFIAGVIFAAALIPINRWIANRIGLYSKGLMSSKDVRLSMTGETMSGVKQIKLHAWEEVFIEKIRKLRTEEVKFLSKRKYLDALCVYFWATTPVLMCFLTFGVSVLIGNPLIASTTYTSVALLNMLIGPLNAFPWVLNGLVEAWISIKRVQELLNLSNLDFSSFYNPLVQHASSASLDANEKPLVLQLKEASFEHDISSDFTESLQQNFCLKRINLDVKKGDLICLEGPIGGGKSTLISAIVAGINCTEGSISVVDFSTGFGYVPQSAWLQRGTIRDNILWGNVFEEKFYKSVLFACGLNEDLQSLGGDLVGVGENGRTLSGGQRVRVALARAVYQDKKIYLLDDILASLDAHVCRHIIKHCILGLLKDKTRIVVTRDAKLFFYANKILHVEDGLVTSSDYMNKSIDLSLESVDDEVESDRRLRSNFSYLDDLQNADEKRSVDSIMLEESREYGHLSLDVLRCYWNAVSSPLAFSVILFVVLMQVSRNFSDAWLAYWVTETTLDPNGGNSSNLSYIIHSTEDKDTVHSTGYYLGVFAALALTNSIMTIVRSFLFAYAGITAAKFIHERLLSRVMFAKFEFFDVTSVGRILNRFSSDTYTIDDSLPFILNILLAQLFGLAGALFISLYAMPWLFLVVVPMVPVYLNLQQRYRHASRDIKRLSSNALSPLYTHFTETLQGLLSIRSMRATARFQRDFHTKLEESTKAQLTAAAAQQWLGLRLQLLGTFLVGGAGFFAAITSAHATNPGLVGLSISYALSITGLLGGLLNAIAETEQEMIAVERVDQYLQLEGEQNADGSADPPFGWPTQGALTFKEVELSYRQSLLPSLKNFSLETGAFERIGIVGRTGAGKSSIMSALLRVAPLNKGVITLDNVNVKALAIDVLRKRIAVLPQDPFLFEGTVRDNLDPRHRFHDTEIWHAITNCSLATVLVQSLGGLDGRLEKGGMNLSAGQKQLLCLARALLKNGKVVCVDEGTSNLDDESEIAMYKALRDSFKSSTVLFIAHRLKGLNTMDRILVIENGEIVEQGTPKELAENSESTFCGMLQAQNLSVEKFCQSI